MADEDSASKEHMTDFYMLMDLVKAGVDDRTLAILHVSYIEKYLGQAVAARLPGLTSRLRESLFDQEGTLGTLGAKNHMAQALGLITPVDHGNISRLSNIRNKFAHNIAITSFEHQDILKLLEKLVYDIRLISGTDEQQKKIVEAWRDSSPRERFHAIALLLNIALHNFINAQHRGECDT
jgi:hypothetical protein